MKFCRYCGNKLNDDDRFCTACGGKCEDNSEVKVETVNATIEESPYVECKICGARVDRGEYSCPVCGAPLRNNTKNTNTNSGYNNYRPASNEKNKMATAGMILGIIGACLIGLRVSFALSGLGLILSIIGLTQINSGKGSNKGQAIAGIILGAAGIVLGVLYMIFIQPILEEFLEQLLEELQNGGEYAIKVMLSILLQ